MLGAWGVGLDRAFLQAAFKASGSESLRVTVTQGVFNTMSLNCLTRLSKGILAWQQMTRGYPNENHSTSLVVATPSFNHTVPIPNLALKSFPLEASRVFKRPRSPFCGLTLHSICGPPLCPPPYRTDIALLKPLAGTCMMALNAGLPACQKPGHCACIRLVPLPPSEPASGLCPCPSVAATITAPASGRCPCLQGGAYHCLTAHASGTTTK